jgi:hypothetical protein
MSFTSPLNLRGKTYSKLITIVIMNRVISHSESSLNKSGTMTPWESKMAYVLLRSYIFDDRSFHEIEIPMAFTLSKIVELIAATYIYGQKIFMACLTLSEDHEN